MTKKQIIITVCIAFSAATGLNAQSWDSDLRLTNDTAGSFIGNVYDNNRCIAVEGDTAHAVWFEEHEGKSEVYYKRSTDAGVTWEEEKRLASNGIISDNPSIGVSGAIVHVIWHDFRDGDEDVYYTRSNDGGSTWQDEVRLTISGACLDPSLAVSGSSVHVVWRTISGVHYLRSIDAGTTWGTDTKLTDSSYSACFPSIAASDSAVHVVWQDEGNSERWNVFYTNSSDGGKNWSAVTQLTDIDKHTYFPSVATSGSAVHVSWQDERNDNLEIYYKRSSDGGITWSPDTRLTTAPSGKYHPSVAASDSIVNVVWEDNRDSSLEEIYNKFSTDGGTSWSPDTRLTDSQGFSKFPLVAASGANVHLIWSDDRDGNYEIYYKHGVIGSAVTEPANKYLNEACLTAENTCISYTITQTSNVVLSIYDITGRAVKSFNFGKVEVGSHTVKLDKALLLRGVYFVRLDAGSFIKTGKLVYLE